MSPLSLSPLLGMSDPAAMQRSMQAGGKQPPAAAAAQQFEAILVRQIVGDALKPVLGSTPDSEMPGRDVYEYLVADVVSQSVAQGGGIGLAKMLFPQLSPKNSPDQKVSS